MNKNSLATWKQKLNSHFEKFLDDKARTNTITPFAGKDPGLVERSSWEHWTRLSGSRLFLSLYYTRNSPCLPRTCPLWRSFFDTMFYPVMLVWTEIVKSPFVYWHIYWMYTVCQVLCVWLWEVFNWSKQDSSVNNWSCVWVVLSLLQIGTNLGKPELSMVPYP